MDTGTARVADLVRGHWRVPSGRENSLHQVDDTFQEDRCQQFEGHRDLVWLLESGDRSEEPLLLHLEFQSQRDGGMSGRMFDYALGMSPSLRDLEICGLVVNTGLRPLAPW